MKLTHWVHKDFVEKVLKGEGITRERGWLKPIGVWLSVNNGWENWCKSEQPDWIGKNMVCLKAKLKKGIKLLVINKAEIFHSEWEKAIGSKYFEFQTNWDNYKKFHEYLYNNYDGIHLTAPALYPNRLSNIWFYGWDCESMVIFNPQNIIFEVKHEK